MQLNNSSPYQILGRMATSINFSPPPPAPKPPLSENKQGEFNQSIANQSGGMRNDVDHLIWMHGRGSHRHQSPSSMNRDVLHFLKNIDFDHIKQRKLDRINATAAAAAGRRSFQFSAIDGTRLGWSSASLAICLSRLISLHEEHQSKLRTKSFYPFRLILSSDEFQKQVDLFGGTIRLNPSATSLQWLGALAAVSDDSVLILKKNQTELKRNLSKVEKALGLRAVKGHTSTTEEYYHCLERLTLESEQNIHSEGKSLLAVSNNKATLIIESNSACRRGRLRKDGNFEVGADMDLNEIRMTIGKFASRSNAYIEIESEKWTRCQEIVDQVMYEFGVQRVSKVSPRVASDQMSECLSMLLNKDEAEKEALRGYLAGQSIGIAGHGQLCHLGDSGSIIIPTNCS
mmetsp:Transcript_26614/g.57216  ORF Transcript_26614/g.57216 Transcript_26614/m.57216 type:complete len:401 (+) Transcript_26614:378-1580(+)